MKNITITGIDLDLLDNPIIILDDNTKHKCYYNDNIGPSAKSTTIRQLQNLVGKTYKSIDTMRWYIIEKQGIVKLIENKSYINYKDFTWNDDMASDKEIWLKNIKEQILNGNKQYRDLYISDTYAFLAPDNYGADTVDEIEIDTNTQLQQAGKEFDKICNDIRNQFVWACQETNQLYLIDKTVNWRVRDFVSEGWYQSEQFDKNSEHRPFAMWRRVANRGSQILTDDMTCIEEHMSKYDKF